MRRCVARTSSSLAALLATTCRSAATLPTLTKPKGGGAATLPALEYRVEDGVKPVITGRQLNLHYNKHHKAYVDKINAIVSGADHKYDGKTIEEIIVSAAALPAEKVLFNQAAQHFNHSFFWRCITPNGKAMPAAVKTAIVAEFGSVEAFQNKFTDTAVGNFGSGWTWLTLDPATKKLGISNTSNAGCPITEGLIPLFTVDVWEHAYYVDFENRRPDYVSEIFTVANWEFVGQCLAAAQK